MAEGEVSFSQVSLSFGDREVLRQIDLCVQAQSTIALLGRSGSGKTTLLRMINGLARPTEGKVTVHGRPVDDYDPTELRRGIGYVIQESGLFPHMTVGRNVALSYELKGAAEADARKRMKQVLAVTGLPADEYAERFPHQLSGGQRQRVGLARSLMSDPAVLLMDEPFGALDPITRSEMQTMLHDLLHQVRKTVVLVTHDLEEALYLADRIVLLQEGQIVADLPAGEVRASQQPQVQEYVRAIRHGNADAAGAKP